jgi:hypothetical protein
VHVEDELILERIGAFLGERGRGRFGRRRVEDRAIDLGRRPWSMPGPVISIAPLI